MIEKKRKEIEFICNIVSHSTRVKPLDSAKDKYVK